MNASSEFAAQGPPARRAPSQPAYREHARSYERQTGAFQRYRKAVVEALPVRRGQVVLDVGFRDGAVRRPAQGQGRPPGKRGRH